jgi:hypothetical protein
MYRAKSSQHRSIRAELLVVLAGDLSIQGMPAPCKDHTLRALALQGTQQCRLNSAERNLINSQRLQHLGQLKAVRRRIDEIMELVGAYAEISRQLVELIIPREAEAGVVALVTEPKGQCIKHFQSSKRSIATEMVRCDLSCIP